MDAELRNMLVKILESQEQFRINQEEFRVNQEEFRVNQEEFKKELKKNTESIAALEDKMMKRTEALFDGYKANTEKISELSEKIDDLRYDLNNFGIKTLRNETKILDIDRRLAK